MVIGLLCILLITVTVVVVKVTMIDPKVNTNISTFKPLPQQILSNSKYTDVGYIPCNGYVPCMVRFINNNIRILQYEIDIRQKYN